MTKVTVIHFALKVAPYASTAAVNNRRAVLKQQMSDNVQNVWAVLLFFLHFNFKLMYFRVNL